MKQIYIIILCTILSLGDSRELKVKNYINYHRDFAQVEEYIVNEKFLEAEKKIDTLFKKYEVKFAKDYIVAAQICILNGNRDKGLEFIRLALKKGVKLNCLKSIKLFKNKISQTVWKSIEKEEIHLRNEYLKTIDLELTEEIHKRYEEEQKAKGSKRYKSIVYSNFKRIKGLMETNGFPGEALIGIDNQYLAKSITECKCGNSKTIATLLHYDYPLSEIGEEKMISEVEKGNLHPREFATIYNFEKNKISVLYRSSTKENNSLPTYNFNLPFGEQISDKEKVNCDRGKFGICRYDVDEKKIEISRKHGIQLNFNYK